MVRASLPAASGVPTPVGQKNAPMPAPAARMRSARLPCGTTSNFTLPARYSPSNTCESACRGNEQITLSTRPAASSAARPVSPLPALLLTMVRLRAPCSISASISLVGIPAMPNPPTRMVAPSAIPWTASTASAWMVVLLITGSHLSRHQWSSHDLKYCGEALAAANAHGLQHETRPTSTRFVCRCRQDAGAGSAHRVAQRDSGAVRVHPIVEWIDLPFG